MNEKQWKSKIKKAAIDVGTYKSTFDPVVDALSKILTQRDAVYQQYIDEGSQAIIEHTSDRGAVNTVKNPLLGLWADLNRDALTYWRDLGLTPAGLKRINEAAVQPKKETNSPLATALLRLSDGA